MRRGQGLFTTLLMLIPMTGVPVMAVFGIPEFVTVSASPFGPSVETTPRYHESRVGQSDALQIRSVAASLTETSTDSLDLFQPYATPARRGGMSNSEQADLRANGTRPKRKAWSDPLLMARPSSSQGQTGFQSAFSSRGSQVQDSRLTEVSQRIRVNASELSGQASVPSQDEYRVPAHDGRTRSDAIASAMTAVRSASEAQPAKHHAQPEARYSREVRSARSSASQETASAGPSLTWQEAVDRLNTLGIRTFRLSPDATENGYRFVCLVTSVEDPRISRRFEAESPVPLNAVQQVIAQVEEWNQQQ